MFLWFGFGGRNSRFFSSQFFAVFPSLPAFLRDNRRVRLFLIGSDVRFGLLTVYSNFRFFGVVRGDRNLKRWLSRGGELRSGLGLWVVEGKLFAFFG